MIASVKTKMAGSRCRMWRVKDLYEVDEEIVEEVNWDGKLKVEAKIRLLKLINEYPEHL